MSGTSADLVGLSAGASAMLASGDTLTATLATLRGDVEMTSSAWAGEAQAAFIKVMAEWDHQSNVLQSTLHRMAELLSTNEKDYTATESDSTSMIGGATSTGYLNVTSLV